MTELKISHQDRAALRQNRGLHGEERDFSALGLAGTGLRVADRRGGIGFESAWVAPQRRRGRGVTANESGRYEAFQRVPLDDGWEGLGDLPALKTHVTVEKPKSIIARNQSPDISFDRSINPYRAVNMAVSIVMRAQPRPYGPFARA
jgi:hypothetical protein